MEQTGTGTDDGSGSAGKREPAGAENALDTLLDELETTPAVVSVAAAVSVVAESVESAAAVEPTAAVATVEATAVTAPVTCPAVAVTPKPVLRRLSSTSSEAGTKPPVPERTPDLQNKRMPPPPPPRTSSKSPVASPTTVGSAVGAPTSTPRGSVSSSSTGGSPPSRKGSLTTVALSGCGKPPMPEPPVAVATTQQLPSPAVPTAVATATRQEQLEQRHQELLKKQKALQEQYTRLQQLQRSQPPPDLLQLKKTGSEGNLLLKMGLSMSAAAPISGSLTQLAAAVTTSATATAVDEDAAAAEKQRSTANNKATAASTTTKMTVSKVYETDII